MKKIVFAALALLTLVTCANAQMVGATNRQQGGFGTTSSDPEYRPTGAVLQFELGSPVAIAAGCQLNSNVMVGGGIGFYGFQRNYEGCYQVYAYHGPQYGYGYDTRCGEVYMKTILPIYAEARFSTPRYRWSAFADMKLGAVIGAGIDWSTDMAGTGATCKTGNPLFMAAQVGFSYKRFSIGFGYTYCPGLMRLDNWDMQPENHSYSCPNISLSYQLSIDKLRSIFL